MAITIAQHKKKLAAQLKEIEEKNTPFMLGVTTALSMLVERVFEDGRDSSNSQITLRRKYDPGTGYSTHPVYINPIDSPRKFPPMGKHGDTGPVGGKPRKTKYFKDGYKGFRRTIGREHNKINLRLTNDLQSDISNSVRPTQGRMVPPGKRKPTQITVNEYAVILKRPINRDKVKGLESRNGGDIFAHTTDEKKELIKVVQFETLRILNK